MDTQVEEYNLQSPITSSHDTIAPEQTVDNTGDVKLTDNMVTCELHNQPEQSEKDSSAMCPDDCGDIPQLRKTSNGTLPDNNTDTGNSCLNRKKKPPNLQINLESDKDISESSPERKPLCREDSKESDTQSPADVLALQKKVMKSLDAGLNSPIVKRTSRLEEIFEIPVMAAALVRDEGYDMMKRRRSTDNNKAISRPCSERQQTPKVTCNQFVFDSTSVETNSTDPDSESATTPSDTSSIIADQNLSPECYKSMNSHMDRPRIEPVGDVKNASELLRRISDCSIPASMFSNSVDKESRQPSSVEKREKLRKTRSIDLDDGGEVTTPTKKSKALLARLRFATLGRSSSSSSMEGWDSLARALVRVGAMSSAVIGDSVEVNPTLTPILKRRMPPRFWKNQESYSPQEPGMKTPLRKKTVSFSRLPSESSVKNATDCVALMQDGHQFVKMRSNSRVYNRLYWFDETMNCLRWEPTKKDAGKARIDIAQISEVRPGKTTELFLTSEISTHFPDECSFSIMQWDGKPLDLIANSADDANVWITGLRCLMTSQDVDGLRMRADGRDTWLSSMFDTADLNQDSYLDEEEAFKLLTSLSDGIRDLRIKQKLQEHFQLKENDRSRLSREEFIEIFKDVATRPEVYFLLVRYASKDDQLSFGDLKFFLEFEQGVTNITNEDCLSIIEEFEPSELTKALPALGIDGFTKYLMSDNCSVFDSKHLQVCQDMTQPLSHYFIASSHNTYLMEDQVSGPSNVNAYVRALLRCCRCVELDCWDGTDGEPVVTHGHISTNKIPFQQIIEEIRNNAFRNSPYPVIICIENHCSEKQQIAMATCLRSVLGDAIYTERKTEDNGGELPSPESMKNSFLIRAKKISEECTDETGYVSEEDEGLEVLSSPGSPADDPFDEPDLAERQRPLVRELSELVSFCRNVRLGDTFSAHKKKYSCHHTSSIHENNALSLVEKLPEEFINHNKKFLTRVYPSGARMDSSNFNPQDFWNCGVQIVSLNYQTPGLMMDINDGKFSMNGGCGYVLKPAIMRDPMAYYSSQLRDSIPGIAPKNLHLRVISGQNFPKPRGGGAKGQVIDPYVLIEIFGIPVDCSEQRTRTALNNSGGSPVFDESFEFRLVLSSLALVRFVVLDDDFIGDEFIGQYTIPFECLLPGYRHLRLRSIFDEPLDNATLFVHIAIADAESISVGTPGATTPVQTVPSGGRLPGKRSSIQKRARKARVRKDADFIQLRDVGQPIFDDLLRGAAEHLHLAATLRNTQRWSMSYFRESCGVTPLANIKQCIHALGQRCRIDAAIPYAVSRQRRKLSSPSVDSVVAADLDETFTSESHRRTTTDGNKRLRRQQSDASQSSVESGPAVPGQATLIRHNRKIALQLKGQYVANESWRKVSLALDALVADSLAVQDKATECCEALTSIYEKAAQLQDDLPKLLTNGNVTTDDSNVGSGTNGTTTGKKKFSKKKHLIPIDLGRRKRQISEENFRWNCSIVKGQRDLLATSFTEIEALLRDLWEVAIEVGLADTTESSHLNGLPNSANENANNNVKIILSQTKSNGRKVTQPAPFKRSISQLTRPKVKSAPKLTKRSLSADGFSITML